MQTEFTTAILDARGARAFIEALDRIGKLYHFDDAPADIVNVRGVPIFTTEEAAQIAARAGEMLALDGFDAFEYAMGDAHVRELLTRRDDHAAAGDTLAANAVQATIDLLQDEA